MRIPLYHVDAFTAKVFHGNPAAVCPLPKWLEDEQMRTIAAENNLSETAFLVAEGGHYALRWFTPRCEVNLCGHATLASGFVILTLLEPAKTSVRFETRSGPLCVQRDGDLFSMDFPALPPWICASAPAELLQGLDPAPHLLLQIKDNYFVVYENEEQVRNTRPDLSLLEKLHPFGVCVTAPGAQVDFVSRYFAPSYGIPEDPVTGSTHCSLAPYWAGRLNKKRLLARQLSQRGGELFCEPRGDRVILAGRAVLYLEGSISI